MRRGDVWWADLPAPVGKRPVLLLSRDKAIQVRDHVTVAQITTTIRNIPVEVPLGTKEGLPKKCVANLDVINTIPKQFLRERITSLSPEKIAETKGAVSFAFGMKSS